MAHEERAVQPGDDRGAEGVVPGAVRPADMHGERGAKRAGDEHAERGRAGAQPGGGFGAALCRDGDARMEMGVEHEGPGGEEADVLSRAERRAGTQLVKISSKLMHEAMYIVPITWILKQPERVSGL